MPQGNEKALLEKMEAVSSTPQASMFSCIHTGPDRDVGRGVLRAAGQREGSPRKDGGREFNASGFNVLLHTHGGLIAMLDEECFVPQGNEKALLEKMEAVSSTPQASMFSCIHTGPDRDVGRGVLRAAGQREGSPRKDGGREFNASGFNVLLHTHGA